MKYIFSDSNIYFDNWHLDNAAFILLINTIKNSESVFLASEIVCKEVQNLYDREKKKAISELKKSYEKAQKFNKNRTPFDPSSFELAYDFKELLKEKIEFIEFFGFDNVSNNLVVNRAIEKKLPFRDNEKGFRDTMIWLSLLIFLKDKTEVDEVFFISKNKNDFYTGENFHEDLLEDFKTYGIKCKITIFHTLNDFIKERVETDEFEFTNESISDQLDDISREIEKDVIFEADIMQTSEFKRMWQASESFLRYTNTLLNHNFEIDEGIEDGVVTSYKRLSKNTLYVDYSFNLRRCTLELTITAEEYIQHKKAIEIFYVSSSLEGDKAFLYHYCRPDLTVSFIYDIEKKTISGFEILTIKL